MKKTETLGDKVVFTAMLIATAWLFLDSINGLIFGVMK